jgi:hypothetical protein
MSIQIHEAALKWRKIKASKEQIEADLMRLLGNPEASDEHILKAKEMYRGDVSRHQGATVHRVPREGQRRVPVAQQGVI